MNALNRIKTHLTGESALSHELTESIFEFADLDVVSLLTDYTVLAAKGAEIHELTKNTQLEMVSLRALQEGLIDITELVKSVIHRTKQHEETLSAVVGLFRHAGSLLNEHTMLTGLSSGFSITGSRDHVRDDHFERITAYSLSAESIESFKEYMQTLLAHGRLVPVKDQTDDNDLELVNLVQSLLLAYGIGMLRFPSRTLFISPPQIWLDCQEIALDAVKKVVLIGKLQQHTDIEIRFSETLPLIDTLLEKAMPSGEIKLEGFWGVKKEAEEIRSTVRLLVP